jgi:hypothetical protein
MVLKNNMAGFRKTLHDFQESFRKQENSMARTFKTREVLQKTALERYENKKKQKNLVGPKLIDTLTLNKLIKSLIGQKIYFYFVDDEELFKGEIKKNVRPIPQGKYYQEIKFDDYEETVQLDLLFENHTWCCTTYTKEYANAELQMDWVRYLLL